MSLGGGYGVGKNKTNKSKTFLLILYYILVLFRIFLVKRQGNKNLVIKSVCVHCFEGSL